MPDLQLKNFTPKPAPTLADGLYISNAAASGDEVISTLGEVQPVLVTTAQTASALGLPGLTTGILKVTTSSGALSTAIASDFPILNQDTTGNADTATNAGFAASAGSANTATTAVNFSGSVGGAGGDVSGTQDNMTVGSVGGQTDTDIADATLAVLAATDSATPSTIMTRDASGGTSATLFTGSLSAFADIATLSPGTQDGQVYFVQNNGSGQSGAVSWSVAAGAWLRVPSGNATIKLVGVGPFTLTAVNKGYCYLIDDSNPTLNYIMNTPAPVIGGMGLTLYYSAGNTTGSVTLVPPVGTALEPNTAILKPGQSATLIETSNSGNYPVMAVIITPSYGILAGDFVSLTSVGPVTLVNASQAQTLNVDDVAVLTATTAVGADLIISAGAITYATIPAASLIAGSTINLFNSGFINQSGYLQPVPNNTPLTANWSTTPVSGALTMRAKYFFS